MTVRLKMSGDTGKQSNVFQILNFFNLNLFFCIFFLHFLDLFCARFFGGQNSVPFSGRKLQNKFPDHGNPVSNRRQSKGNHVPANNQIRSIIGMSCVHVSGSRSRPRCQTNVASSHERQLVGEMCHQYTIYVHPS